MQYGLPDKHGLYDPENEKDACGVGFVAQIKGVPGTYYRYIRYQR